MSASTDFSADQHKALRSVRTSRIILPILIGIGVVAYLFYQQFDLEEWNAIQWTTHTLIWVGISLTMLSIRHLAYAMRLYILSEKDFSYKKCIELIFIWEFSSAVSPTSVGGSAVALFVLSQEKLSAGRTASLVLYTVVLDSAFFIFTLPVLYMFLGPMMIRPGAESLADLSGWGYGFIIGYVLMATYALFLFWGLFISPSSIRKVLSVLARWRILKRFRKTIVTMGNDMITASKQMRMKPFKWHAGAFLSTAIAWSFRFLLLSCLFIAFTDVGRDLLTQTALYARLESMFVIIAFSPTPGGAGFVETLFNDFLDDFVAGNMTSALLIATLWRGFTYYAYLLAGVVVIPNWIRGVIARRAKEKEEDDKRVRIAEAA